MWLTKQPTDREGGDDWCNLLQLARECFSDGTRPKLPESGVDLSLKPTSLLHFVRTSSAIAMKLGLAFELSPSPVLRDLTDYASRLKKLNASSPMMTHHTRCFQ